MRQPWSAPAAWNFVTALLASPGFAVLVPTQRHADLAAEVITLSCRTSPAICSTMRTRPFSCASTITQMRSSVELDNAERLDKLLNAATATAPAG